MLSGPARDPGGRVKAMPIRERRCILSKRALDERIYLYSSSVTPTYSSEFSGVASFILSSITRRVDVRQGLYNSPKLGGLV
jgi:hypothetical protein